MKKFFNLYQFIGPLVLGPLAYYLWYKRFNGSHDVTILVLSIPIITAYILPGIGTNVKELWEFNTRLRLGKFRPHHGFVFGSAMSLMAYFCIDLYPLDLTPFIIFSAGLVTGSVMGFWNWIYDAYAIKAGYITVYNRRYYKKDSPAAIAMDYAPAYFGGFGFCYGIQIKIIQYYLLGLHRSEYYWFLFIICNIIAMVVPVVVFVSINYLKYKESGLKTYKYK